MPVDSVNVAALRAFTPLDGLKRANLTALAKKTDVRKLSSGQSLFKLGDSDKRTFYLMSGRLQLTDKDGNRTVLDDAETDLYFRYGWTIPVQSLRYWALGIPDPASPADTEFDGDGQLQSLVQGGWNVSITRYGEGGGQQMPTRLTAVGEETRVKLVIHNWLFFDQPRL